MQFDILVRTTTESKMIFITDRAEHHQYAAFARFKIRDWKADTHNLDDAFVYFTDPITVEDVLRVAEVEYKAEHTYYNGIKVTDTLLKSPVTRRFGPMQVIMITED